MSDLDLSMTSLPSPRALLTDLISSLPIRADAERKTLAKPGNALQNLTPTDRHLLSTLHVLFPALLLPSLDLLDRGLVTRLVQVHEQEHEQERVQAPVHEEEEGAQQPSASNGEQEAEAEAEGPLPPPIASTAAQIPHVSDRSELSPQSAKHIYQVQSARERRGKRLSYSTAPSYMVRLRAWNCTCAAFTYSAFPGNSTSHGRYSYGEEEGEGEGEGERGDLRWGMPVAAWEFGGLSLDGVEGEAVPCCKHLLACLLAERWESVLGDYVRERHIHRDEMAGLGAEA